MVEGHRSVAKGTWGEIKPHFENPSRRQRGWDICGCRSAGG